MTLLIQAPGLMTPLPLQIPTLSHPQNPKSHKGVLQLSQKLGVSLFPVRVYSPEKTTRIIRAEDNSNTNKMDL